MDKEQANLLIPEQSKEFEEFRDEIIKRLGLTWGDWCWLWDKISIGLPPIKPSTAKCSLCGDTGEVLNSKARTIGYTIAPNELGDVIDEKLVPCPLCSKSPIIPIVNINKGTEHLGELRVKSSTDREAVAYIRDAILAINSYSNYECLGLEDRYDTPAESYDREGMEQAEEVVDQILSLMPKVLDDEKILAIYNEHNWMIFDPDLQRARAISQATIKE